MNDYFPCILSNLVNTMLSPLTILSLDEQGFRCLYANRAAVQAFGAVAEQFGARLDDIHAPELATHFSHLYFESLESKHEVSFTETFHAPSGESIETTFVLPFFSQQSGMAFIVSILHLADSTEEERHQREEMASFLISNKAMIQQVLHESEGRLHQSLAEVELRESLLTAIRDDQLELYYQPLIDLTNGTLVSAEALMRWNHPIKGLIPPMDFIPYAERSGLIIPMTEWLLHRACEQYRRWQTLGLHLDYISVNISASHFHQNNLTEMIAHVLRETELPPHCLQLEVTESVVMSDIQLTIDTLSALKAMGVRIALDDFGTGASSLTYLKYLPLDILKIDKSFILEMPASQKDAIIVDVILKLGHHLDMKVVAEGVESAEHSAILRQLDCDIGQGYYFSKPLPFDEFTKRYN